MYLDGIGPQDTDEECYGFVTVQMTFNGTTAKRARVKSEALNLNSKCTASLVDSAGVHWLQGVGVYFEDRRSFVYRA